MTIDPILILLLAWHLKLISFLFLRIALWFKHATLKLRVVLVVFRGLMTAGVGLETKVMANLVFDLMMVLNGKESPKVMTVHSKEE